AGTNRRWRWPFRCRGSRRESAVVQFFSLGIVMSSFGVVKRAFRVLSIPFGVYLLLVIGTYCYQRSLLFFPTHLPPVSRLTAWQVGGSIIGYCREVTNARA